MLAGAVLPTDAAAQRISAANRARRVINLACPGTVLSCSVAVFQEFGGVQFLLGGRHRGLLLRRGFLFLWGGGRR
jgi:hypothetical protein